MVNVILDAKKHSYKLCSVDGLDVVSEVDIKIDLFMIFFYGD